MISTKYTVITPVGWFEAIWDDDEDVPVRYEGGQEAQEYFRAYLALNLISGRNGALLRMERMEPVDLYGFCQSEEYSITVMPDFDGLVAIMAARHEDEEAAGEDPVGMA